MYVQSNRLAEPVFPPNSSSSSTPINCEVVDVNGFVWSKDMHDVSNRQSQICVVICTSCHVYCELIAKSVITHDQDSTMTFVISSSPPSITPCPEATSLAVLSVNDEVNERMNTIMEEEEDISTMFPSITTTMTTMTTPAVKAIIMVIQFNVIQWERKKKPMTMKMIDCTFH